jgi:hypothetical protein
MSRDVLMDLHDVMVCVFVGVRRRNRLPEGQGESEHHGGERLDQSHGSAIMAVGRRGRQRGA